MNDITAKMFQNISRSSFSKWSDDSTVQQFRYSHQLFKHFYGIVTNINRNILSVGVFFSAFLTLIHKRFKLQFFKKNKYFCYIMSQNWQKKLFFFFLFVCVMCCSHSMSTGRYYTPNEWKRLEQNVRWTERKNRWKHYYLTVYYKQQCSIRAHMNII